MLRTAVPRLAVKLTPLTFKSLISVTESPAFSRAPLLSLCLTVGASPSKVPVLARAKVSSSSTVYQADPGPRAQS